MERGVAHVRLDDAPHGLRSLAQWLRSESELRGRVRLTEHSIEPGDMGGALDAVAIALGSGGAATIFVRSLFTWLSQRQVGTSVRIQLKRPDGTETTLDLAAVHDPDAVVDKVLNFLATDE